MAVTVNFDQMLLNYEGEPLRNEDDSATRLGFIAAFSLAKSWQGDKRDEKQIMDDWKLSQQIGKSRPEVGRFGEVRLENKQAAHLADVIRSVYPSPMIAAQCAELLEGVPEKDSSE